MVNFQLSSFQSASNARPFPPFAVSFPATHRYTLQPYAGTKSRTICPACGKPRCFTRYLDTETGELLPDDYGRCDHEAHCGYHRNPYHAGPDGTSYARQAHGAAKLLSPKGRVAHSTVRRVPAVSAPVPVISIPTDVFMATQGSYERNALARLLRGHFGLGVADELLSRFQLGTSTYWPGACVFWLVDEQGRVRGGQVVLYDATGHTVKEPRRCTTWAHTAIAEQCQRRGQPTPPWLAAYAAQGQKSPCLFGLPQLATAPTAQPIALVESAKTAMMATPYQPGYVWLATMGLSYLTPERLAPIRSRRIVLFPDAGALDKWQAKTGELRRLGFNVHVSTKLEELVTDEERRAGHDLADVLLSEWPGYPPNWDEKLGSL
jgi:hypothetical protein